MKLLLDDTLEPLTSEFGFLETDIGRAVDSFVGWRRSLGEGISVKPVESHSLRDVLVSLLPLTDVDRRRFLFLPTRSQWVAYLDNGTGGTDAFSAMSFMAKRLGCRGARVVAIPDTAKNPPEGRRGRYGGTVLELYGPRDGEFLNYIRAISAINDFGKWRFDQAGTPQAFENPRAYRALRVRDRFTPEMLRDYLAALGLHPFDEQFFITSPGPTLVEKRGSPPQSMREFSLKDARL